jgi:hypothetical protein
MAYASANTEVLGYTGFSTVYSTTTMPTLAQVSDIIEQVEGEINTALSGLGLTVPVTNATLIDYIRKQSAMGSAGLTLQRYGQNDADFRLADWFYTKYETWIEKLITDEKYQNSIKEIVGGSAYTGIYIGSNFTDGTHFESTPKISTIEYGIDGFK